MLTSLIRLPIIPFAVEDIYSSSLTTLFPNDVQTSHGDAGSYVIYKSKRFGDLELRLTNPSIEDERWLFAHFVWNASVQMAEYVSGCATGLNGKEKRSWDVTGEKVLELGAGSGLAGIVSALAGADEVVISDYPSPEVLANINVNVEKNVPEYIRNRYIHQHHTLRLEASLETIKNPLKANVKSPQTVSPCSHKWGDLTDPLAQSHAQHFTRIMAADCLWMVGEHENLVESILHFLSRDEAAQVWVIAGFHTGRAKVAAFFDTAVDMGLKISRIYERDVEGCERAWAPERDRGREDVTERKRWLVVAILKRKPSPTTSEWRNSSATLALPDESRFSIDTLVPESDPTGLF